MSFTIKYLPNDKPNTKFLFDITSDRCFASVWQKVQHLCKPGHVMKFSITQKESNASDCILLCWFAVFKNDQLSLLWQGSAKHITRIDDEIQDWKSAEADIEKNLSVLPNSEVLCYQNGTDVRFLTSQIAYIGVLQTEMEDWKSCIYL